MKTARFLRVAGLLLLCVALLGFTCVSAAPSAPSAAIPPGGWTPWPTPALTVPGPLFAVATAAANDAWAVGAGGGIYHYDGESWSAVKSTVTESLESVYPVQANTALVVGAPLPAGNQPVVSACTPAGCTRDTAVPAVGMLDSISALSPTDYWAVGGGGTPGAEFGTILHFTGTWSTNLATGTAATVHLHNIQMLSASEGWAVGESTSVSGPGTLFHYATGTGWQEVKPNIAFSGPLHGLWFISAKEGWVVGGTLSADPVILHYKASATPQWTREAVTKLGVPETLLWYVNMRPDGSGYAGGNGGQILFRDPALGTWQSVFTDPRPPLAPFYGVWLAPGGTLGWAVGGIDGSNAGVFAQFWLPAVVWLPFVAH